jgi:hypothetical protein
MRRHSSKEKTMRGESVISTTGARGALAGTNAAARQGQASIGGSAARAVPAANNAAGNASTSAIAAEDKNGRITRMTKKKPREAEAPQGFFEQ